MSHQIFKDDIPNDILFSLLNDICSCKNDKYFVVDKIALKKAQFNKKIQPFLDSLDKYYHESKKFYITRKLNYTKFITIKMSDEEKEKYAIDKCIDAEEAEITKKSRISNFLSSRIFSTKRKKSGFLTPRFLRKYTTKKESRSLFATIDKKKGCKR